MGSIWSSPNASTATSASGSGYYPSGSESPGNGQWNYVSSGVSSFDDGQQAGGQMYSNVNGQVHHETIGNMEPGQGYFQSISSNFNPAPVSATIALFGAAVLILLVAALVSVARRNKLLKGRKAVATDVERQEARGTQQNYSIPFLFSPKRPFADAMGNSDLLMEEMVEIKLTRND